MKSSIYILRQTVYKKLVAFVLIVSMGLSGALVSYAGNVDGSADNSDGGSSTTGAGGDFGCNTNTQGRIGLRFSLVDVADPGRVVSVNDAGEPTVIDVWFMNQENFEYYTQERLTKLSSSNYLTAVKTQSIDSINKPTIVTWNKVGNLSFFASIPHWMVYDDSKKIYQATGKDLQYWEEAVVDVNGKMLKYGNIINMLEKWKNDSGNLMFKTEQTRGKTVTKEDGTVESMTVTYEGEPSNKQYKLLIESLIMFTPVASNTTSSILTSKVAGTFSNIAEYWQTVPVLKTLEYKYGARSYLNWKAFNQTGVHALSVSNSSILNELVLKYTSGGAIDMAASFVRKYAFTKLVKFDNGNVIYKSELSKIPTWSEMAYSNMWRMDPDNGEVYKDGFGVNIYSLDGLLNEPASTWDRERPDEPGPVPEPEIPVSDGIKVVKYYEDSKDNGLSYETVGVYGREQCERKLFIEDENSYKIKEFFFSSNDSSYIENGSTSYGEQREKYNNLDVIGTGTGGIEVCKPAEVMHILLQKSGTATDTAPTATAKLTLYQDEISRPYSLDSLCSGAGLSSLYEAFDNKSGLSKTCTSRHDLDDDCRGNDEDGYYCDGRHRDTGESVQTDGNYNLSVADTFDYAGGTSFIRDYVTSDTGVTGSIGLSGGNTESFAPNANFLYYRDNTKDKVTLYAGKNNNAVKERVKAFGVTAEGYKPAGTRYEKTSALNAGTVFNNTLITHFTDTTADRELGYDFECSFGHGFGGGSYKSSSLMFLSELNGRYSQANNAETKVYVGQTNTGLLDVTDVRDAYIKRFNYSQSYLRQKTGLNFYPYVKMNILEKAGNTAPVYVTSENQSTMAVYNSVQVGVHKKSRINANLTSTQWSTHKRSLNFLQDIEVTDKKSVLAGGAITNLDMGNKGDTQVGVRLYQAALEDGQVGKVVEGGFNTSVTQAKEAANAYFEEGKIVLGGYGLVLRGATGAYINSSDFVDDSDVITPGARLPFDYGTRTMYANKDNKYYLRQDGEGSSRANFDVLEAKINSQVYYSIASDTEGNVMVYKNGTEIARATKTQDSSTFSTNTELKVLDDNTKLISNYMLAVDRNKGQDKSGNTWYNEAFEGVGVLVTDIVYDLGFDEKSAVRSTAIDTKILGLSNSKSELYSFEPGQVRTLAYYTTAKSSANIDNCKYVGYLATLNGQGAMANIRTVVGNIDTMVYSKLFYINNFSVSDLN